MKAMEMVRKATLRKTPPKKPITPKQEPEIEQEVDESTSDLFDGIEQQEEIKPLPKNGTLKAFEE
jgi:hypothetical protein